MLRKGRLFAAALLAAAVTGIVAGRLGREELIHREGNILEHFAGIIAAAAGAAVAGFVRQAVVVYRHEQLAVPLQADDGKLTQGDKDPAVVISRRQVTAEALAHTGGDLTQVTVAAAAVAAIYQLGAQDDGIHCLHNGNGHITLLDKLLIQGVQPHPGGEYLGGAFAAEEDYALVKDAQALHFHGSGAGAKGADGHTVEETHIHGVAATVKGYRLHIDVGIQQLGLAAFDGLGTVEDFLAGLGGIEAQILNTIFITTWSDLEEMAKRPEGNPSGLCYLGYQ